ncbi:unnamed protein product [Ilex paraguariensis]|uniref:Phytocyanin domain-containing protein n=1 Tax=Ilex paraguariensis TaxID=185542 RepID=A0ABC8QLQ8_9AQUA
MAMAAALLLLLLAAPAVYAVQHTVGGSTGWNTGYNYVTWAAGQSFAVGDTLLFTYGPTHSLDLVGQSDYTNCATGNALSTYSGGSNIITLNTTGTVYFLCPTPGHCGQGMKLAVTVGSGPSTSPPGTTNSPPPPPPPPPSSASPSIGINRLILGLTLGLGLVLAFMG